MDFAGAAASGLTHVVAVASFVAGVAYFGVACSCYPLASYLAYPDLASPFDLLDPYFGPQSLAFDSYCHIVGSVVVDSAVVDFADTSYAFFAGLD